MELGSGIHFDYATESCFAMRTGSKIPMCNRILHTKLLKQDDIDKIKTYFADLPISWFVADTDHDSIIHLQNAGFEQMRTYPAMSMNLSEMRHVKKNNHHIIKEIFDEKDIKKWISIVSKGFDIDSKEFTIALHYILNNAAPNSVKLYLGYNQEKAVATSMAVYHKDVISLHWIAVLPKYRGLGFGTDATTKSLLDARSNGGKQAILLASPLGKTVYEKIGFKEYAFYKVFGKK